MIIVANRPSLKLNLETEVMEKARKRKKREETFPMIEL